MHRLRALGRRAISAIEFALVAPILLLLLLGAADFGGALQQATALETAARAGAQFALARPSDTAGIEGATRAALPDGWAGNSNVQATRSCFCSGTASACDATCVNNIQVVVTVTRPYTTLLPLLPNWNLTGDATIRFR